jgi:hypothetical protein
LSKDRQRRRKAREAEVAARAAERERKDAARRRRDAWKRKLTGWLPARRGPTPGLLAAKRRRTTGLLALAFFAIQFLTWVATPAWGMRLAVFVVCVFAFPVLYVLAS